MVRAGAIALAASLAALPADACRLALVMAIDVSNSVDATEDALQRQGVAAALVAPEVQAAFFVSPDPVSLLIFEWSGRHHQQLMVDWTEILTPADLAGVAAIVGTSQRRQRDFPTALGHALGYAATRLVEKQDCLSQTIDVAGDGRNNDGFGPGEAYDAFPFDGVTVNALAVDASILETRDALVSFFENEVIRGAGAFVEVANGFDDYEATMRRKLVRELLSQVVGEAGPPPFSGLQAERKDVRSDLSTSHIGSNILTISEAAHIPVQ
ncbi:MAG: DUF1194 domain-containing protein [Pseudomonadota bacterium]